MTSAHLRLAAAGALTALGGEGNHEPRAKWR